MSKDKPVIVANELTKVYGDLTALDQFSISINQGQILGLIGPNGAGKTTAIKILVGLARPTSGSASIAGADCSRDARRIKRLVGYMPDIFGYYDNMRVREYLDFFGAAFQIGRKKRKLRIGEVLETTGAAYMQDMFVESLSHGMKQRVAVARTLIHDPEVLILDEPTNGLDPQARVEIRDLILTLAKAGKTIIVTSHILPELSRICDIIAILSKGKLRAFGTLPEIMRTVSQRRMIEVQLVDKAQMPLAVKSLQEVSEAKDVSESQSEGIVRFHTDQSEEELSGLLADLIGKGIKVSQFRELQSDLEDAFLSVTEADSRTGAHDGSDDGKSPTSTGSVGKAV